MLSNVGKVCEQLPCIVKYLYALKLWCLIIVSLPLTNHNFSDGWACLNLTILSFLSLVYPFGSIHFLLTMIIVYLVNCFSGKSRLICKYGIEIEKEGKRMQRWYFKALIFVLQRFIIKPTVVLSVWSRMHRL